MSTLTSYNFAGNSDYALILPREIWFRIGKRLVSRLDVLRFRSVCRTWRSVLPAPLRFPLRVPRPPGPTPIITNDDATSYFIAEVTFYAAADTIVVFEEEYRGGEFSASALVHKKQAAAAADLNRELPPASQISRLSFLCNAYHLHNAYPRYELKWKRLITNKFNIYGNNDVLKIAIISSDGDGATNINPNYPKLRDLKVVAHLSRDRKLAVLSLGGGAMNNDWETGFCDVTFIDIVSYNGRLYGVDKWARAFVMDHDSLHMTQVAAPLFDDQGWPFKTKVMHLAVVSGDLYMFIHLRGGGSDGLWRLYKLSVGLGRWLGANQDLPGHFFVQNVQCNFAVSRDLFRGGGRDDRGYNGVMKYPVPRVCAWPEFEFVQLAVGLSHAHQSCRISRYLRQRRSKSRWCDFP